MHMTCLVLGAKSLDHLDEMMAPYDEANNVWNEETEEYEDGPPTYWDWWQLGGRWRGMFVLKPGATGILGDAGVGGNEARVEGGVDFARLGDIDIDAMRLSSMTRYAEDYDKIMSALAGEPMPPVPERHGAERGDWDAFHNHPTIVAVKAVYPDLFGIVDLARVWHHVNGEREGFLNWGRDSAIPGYSFLAPEVGWVDGWVSYDSAETTWAEGKASYLSKVNMVIDLAIEHTPDANLALVDYHS